MSKPTRIPLFPLTGAILFPRSHLPLHIFEDRYRAMIEDAMSGPGRIAMIQPSDDKAPGLYQVGCVGELVGVEELDDGRYNIMLLGSQRFRLIGEADGGTPYRQADIDLEAFDDDDPEPLSSIQRADVERQAQRIAPARPSHPQPSRDSDPRRCAAANAIAGTGSPRLAGTRECGAACSCEQ